MSYDYDLIVLGGGAAGLTASGLGASLGAKTLLVERDRLGGDCTWTGCIPSKTLLKSATVAHRMRRAGAYGLPNQKPDMDFGQVMEHVRQTRRHVYEDADAPEHLEEFGVEVQHGAAHFADPHTLVIETDDGLLRRSARYVVIATGGQPATPPIDGLDAVDYRTSESLFDLIEQPKRLAVLGAGPIGTEMAQAFARLGTQVTVIDRADRILQHDNRELADQLQAVLEDEGIRYVLEADIEHVSEDSDAVTMTIEQNGERRLAAADTLLVATGRQPNVEDLDLETAGVAYTKQGVTVDGRCRTSQPHIFAAGDVTGRYQFTHMSEHMAKIAVSNALLKVPQSIDSGRVPWVTYTDPELAHVGATEKQLREEGASFEVYRFPFEKLDRAVTEQQTTGLIKVFATRWRGKIRGASILGARAGELIGTVALAMKTGATLRQVSDTIFPYPTYGQGVRRAADQWYAQKQQPWIVRSLQRVFGYSGPVPEPDPDRIV